MHKHSIAVHSTNLKPFGTATAGVPATTCHRLPPIEVPGNGWAQIVAFAGYYELFVYKFNGTPGDPGPVGGPACGGGDPGR